MAATAKAASITIRGHWNTHSDNWNCEGLACRDQWYYVLVLLSNIATSSMLAQAEARRLAKSDSDAQAAAA